MCRTHSLPNSHTDFNTPTTPAAGGFDASNVAGGARLGNKGDLSYPDEFAQRKPGHSGRYRAQRVMRDVLPDDFGIHTCGCRINYSAGVRSDGQGETRMEGIAHCGNGHICPVCGGRIAAARAEEIRAAVAAASALGLKTVLVTLTIQHRTSDKLADLLADLMGAWSYAYANAGAARVRFNERFGVVGFIRALEVRYSRRAGWHPHYHLLVFVDDGAGVDDIETELHDRIFQRYAHFLTSDDDRIVCKRRNRRGYHANDKTVDVRVVNAVDEYLTKIASEVSLGQGKGTQDASLSPFQLATLYADTSENWVPGLLREYAAAMRGRAAIRWSRGLRDLLRVGPYVNALWDDDARPSKRFRLLRVLVGPKWGTMSHDDLISFWSAMESGGVLGVSRLIPVSDIPRLRDMVAYRVRAGLLDILELGDELTDEELAGMDDLPDDEGDTPDALALPMPYVFLDDGPAYASLWRRGMVGELRDIAGHVNGWDSGQVYQLYQWVATVTGMPDGDIEDAVMRVWWINEKLLAGGEMELDASAELAAADREKWRSAWRSARHLYQASKDLVAQCVRPDLWPDKLRAAGFTVDEIEPFMRRYWSGLPLSPDVGDGHSFTLPPAQTSDDNTDSPRLVGVDHGV